MPQSCLFKRNIFGQQNLVGLSCVFLSHCSEFQAFVINGLMHTESKLPSQTNLLAFETPGGSSCGQEAC